MARKPRPQSDRLKWPLNAQQVEALDGMLEELFKQGKVPGFSGVETDSSLTGDGTAGDPLAVVFPPVLTQNKTRVITFDFDGAGQPLIVGAKVYVTIPVAVTLTGWRIIAQDGLTGAVQLDVWADTYANFPPTNSDSITNAHEPNIPATDDQAEDTDISDWTDVTMPAGTIMGANVDSVTTLTHVTLYIFCTVDQ